ncbi:MAG TPA: ribosome small subunit-dependent GTPase A [Clostridia bacterium]|nr:ribosome small subunit-dependent GTPase A [Clostridia bacterium]
MNTNIDLKALGWNENLEKEFAGYKDACEAGRVAVEYKGLYKVYCENKEVLAVVSGKMMYSAAQRDDYPAVGDWVVLDKPASLNDKAIIRGILSRKSKFSRKCAGNTIKEQIIAVNIDTVFICMSLNQNFNLRRLERFITMAWNSGSTPVVLLTKSDLCDDIEEKLEETQEVALGVDIHCISCLDESAAEAAREYIRPGHTVAFLGSSGVGKSTIINRLLGETRLDTQEISSLGDRGRHTTTNRELILLPEGGIVIDTPGMREFHILDVDESINTTFEDIEALAKSCRFSDCTHTTEPQCAVREAIAGGSLSEERYNNYIKLKREAEFIERKTNKKAELEYKSFIKRRAKSMRIK